MHVRRGLDAGIIIYWRSGSPLQQHRQVLGQWVGRHACTCHRTMSEASNFCLTRLVNAAGMVVDGALLGV